MMPAAAWGPRLLCKLSQQKGPRMRADFQDRADFENADQDAPDPNFAVVTP
jgi:hypothetical protein